MRSSFIKKNDARRLSETRPRSMERMHQPRNRTSQNPHRGTWTVDTFARHRDHACMTLLRHARQAPALIALGESIRRHRRALSLSQEQLALLANVDRSYLGRVERGDNNVALLTLIRLAAALEMSVASLMAQAGI